MIDKKKINNVFLLSTHIYRWFQTENYGKHFGNLGVAKKLKILKSY